VEASVRTALDTFGDGHVLSIDALQILSQGSSTSIIATWKAPSVFMPLLSPITMAQHVDHAVLGKRRV
jgi:hypothetical protein